MDLTANLALQRAKAVEVVHKETEAMQKFHKESKLEDHGATHRIHSAKLECYRCGKPYHSAADCRFKDATCHVCKKVGHLARVCQSRKKKTGTAAKAMPSKNSGVHQLQESDSDSDSSSDSALHSVFQLGGSGRKFLVSVRVNGVDVEMEIDSGAERTTIPWSYFNQYLSSVCKLRPNSVTLYQYDKSLHWLS